MKDGSRKNRLTSSAAETASNSEEAQAVRKAAYMLLYVPPKPWNQSVELQRAVILFVSGIISLLVATV